MKAAPDSPRAASSRLITLTKRSDFLRASRARRKAMPGFILQASLRGKDQASGTEDIRVGYTCSKKVGNAVARNRAKRRLREIARHVIADHGKPGFDYVLIGRATHTAALPFTDLQRDLRDALRALHKDAPR
ncbi:ribonuclease P protein component [Roseobacteraceae bacterium S113]